jgi:hypothetical protein
VSDCKYEEGGSRKYVLLKTFVGRLQVKPPSNIYTGDCTLLCNGSLVIYKGYEWDGPSGPAVDTDNFMDGSLIHDMLYQLMREGELERWPYRLYADNEMFRQCKKDDMSLPRRCWTWLGVRIGGYFSAR